MEGAPFEGLEVSEDVQTGQSILLIDLSQFIAEQLRQKLLEVDIHVFAAPLRPSRRGDQLVAKELLLDLTQQFVDCDVDSPSAAVQHHHHLALAHLLTHCRLGVLPALDRSPFRLEAEQEVGVAEGVDDLGLVGCLPHEELVLLAPEGRDGEHPPDPSCGYLPHLFT